MLIAFNAAPGTAAREKQGPYGPYAQALAEMMREGGLPLADLFERTRLRVNERTGGGEVPWHASRVQASVVFFERAPDAPPLAASVQQTTSLRSQPIRDLDAQQAYLEVLDRDTLQGYLDFLAAYPDDPMAKRVRAIVAARREAITWRQTRSVDTPDAYWSYLSRYPRGPHAADARRRLAFLAAALEPPPSFPEIDYDAPPPPPEEYAYIEQPVLIFDDPVYAFPPPPPPLIFFLPPPPPEFIILEPPPPPIFVFVLPIPVFVPVPIWCHPPAYVAPPPNNVIFANIHNRVEINNRTNIVTITNPAGERKTLTPPTPSGPPGTAGRVGAVPTAPVLGPALPPSVAQKAIAIQNRAPPQAAINRAQPGPVRRNRDSGQGSPWDSHCLERKASHCRRPVVLHPKLEGCQPISRVQPVPVQCNPDSGRGGPWDSHCLERKASHCRRPVVLHPKLEGCQPISRVQPVPVRCNPDSGRGGPWDSHCLERKASHCHRSVALHPRLAAPNPISCRRDSKLSSSISISKNCSNRYGARRRYHRSSGGQRRRPW